MAPHSSRPGSARPAEGQMRGGTGPFGRSAIPDVSDPASSVCICRSCARPGLLVSSQNTGTPCMNHWFRPTAPLLCFFHSLGSPSTTRAEPTPPPTTSTSNWLRPGSEPKARIRDWARPDNSCVRRAANGDRRNCLPVAAGQWSPRLVTPPATEDDIAAHTHCISRRPRSGGSLCPRTTRGQSP
jgi:hypothetical protein